jgi:hypothetical protein
MNNKAITAARKRTITIRYDGQDSQRDLSAFENDFLKDYNAFIDNNGGRGRTNIKWSEMITAKHTFGVCPDFTFKAVNNYDCLLGYVRLPNNTVQRRWWWKSGSCGTWRAGINFKSSGWTSKGVYEKTLPVGHKYIKNLGYINETAVCMELQIIFDNILGNKDDHKYCLSLDYDQILQLRSRPCFEFLNDVLSGSALEYAKISNLPQFLKVIKMSGKEVILNPNQKKMLNNASSTVNRELAHNQKINIKNYRNDSREILSGMINAIHAGGGQRFPDFNFTTENVARAKVFVYESPITVGGSPDITHVVFEVAQGETAEPKYTAIRGDKGNVYTVWLKQLYLKSNQRENITSFGNHAFFSSNLAGLIQKSADYEGQTEGVRNHKLQKRTVYYGDKDGKDGKYRHLARWNEKSSDIVREFKYVMNLDHKYQAMPEKEFIKDIKTDIGTWFGAKMLSACYAYLRRNPAPGPSKNWFTNTHSDGRKRVTALKIQLEGLNFSYINSDDSIRKLLHKNVGGVRYSGSTTNNNANSYLTILADLMNGDPINAACYDEKPALAGYFKPWINSACSNGIGKLWLHAKTVTPKDIIDQCS